MAASVLEAQHKAVIPEAFFSSLASVIPPQRIIRDYLRCYAYGTDASFYRLTPQAVVQIDSEVEMVEVLRLCHDSKVPVTFRGAGTSLSGQAVTDSILLVLTPSWRKLRVLAKGAQITLQPGVIGHHANLALLAHQRKLGPDPASMHSCTIGGIAANNASGMCCGVKNNSYHTAETMRIIFADGSVLDTSSEESIEQFKKSNQKLLKGIIRLREIVQSQPELASRIRQKYEMKNTTGFGINALLDFEEPIEILQHLMIGSEGTLGFISEITYRTVPIDPYRAAGFFFFDSLENCLSFASSAADRDEIKAIELMDDKSLSAVTGKINQLGFMNKISKGSAACLLEISARTQAECAHAVEFVRKMADMASGFLFQEVSENPNRIDDMWSIRKGLFPSVGAMKKSGTTVVIEDVSLPLNSLAQAAVEIKNLFSDLGYEDAILFGHARDGNLHIVFSQSFETDRHIANYRDLMDRLTSLVAMEYGGALKAEHGTGRNMAAYVEKEWGRDAYELMIAIKNVFDPNGILNPGVIINEDHEIHLKNLKKIELVDPIIDHCIECGFCEPVCPSRDLTLTPRQRIAIERERVRLKKTDAKMFRKVEQNTHYFVDQTCASDGLCGMTCPVSIDTGKLVKLRRSQNHSDFTKALAKWTADQFEGVTRMISFGLGVGHFLSRIFGNNLLEKVSRGVNAVSGMRIPVWLRELPKPLPKFSNLIPIQIDSSANSKKMGYFPSCVSRVMGDLGKEEKSYSQIAISSLTKAGYQAVLPKAPEKLCCGLVYASKGFPEIAVQLRDRVLESMKDVNVEEFLCDVSPCAQWLKQGTKAGVSVLDSVEFIAGEIEHGKYSVNPIKSGVVHCACSVKAMGLEGKLRTVVAKMIEAPIYPSLSCCGFSGDKGLFVPQLSESSLETISEVRETPLYPGYTTSPTCGIGMGRATKKSYSSILSLFMRTCEKKTTL